MLLRNLFALASLDSPGVDGIIIASVVPSLDANLAAMAQRYFRIEPMFVTPHTDIGMAIRYDDPNQVGADRLANAVAALHKYGGPCVVVDLGTTVNFDCISANAEYLGGAIAIGIGISIEALFSKTARLPMVDFREPAKVIGSNTVGSMHSGLYYGALGMIDGILDRIIAELGPHNQVDRHRRPGRADRPRLAPPETHRRTPDARGLQLIWERNAAQVNDDWIYNYFNYFTEIEEHFQRVRGTSLFLLSPLDWALIESWKNADVPLEAVLRGIDAAFEQWRGRKIENPDGEFARLLRTGRSHRSPDHGRNRAKARRARIRAALSARRSARLSRRVTPPPCARPAPISQKSPPRWIASPPKPSTLPRTWKISSAALPFLEEKAIAAARNRQIRGAVAGHPPRAGRRNLGPTAPR